MDEHYREILRYNKGFESPSRWIQYAREHNFQKVSAKKVRICPECGGDTFSSVGQYIYYSNLITLQHCKQCGLYFADTHIDPGVVAQHFENAYNDEIYFLHQRKDIFSYIAYLADMNAPLKGKVLDIGGGKGHLLSELKRRRQDLDVTLNDLSSKSCRYANRCYGLKSVCCTIPDLEKLSDRFDVILLIDVIYYEPDLNRMWHTLDYLLKPAGTLIIRIPNKLGLIRFSQKIRYWFFNVYRNSSDTITSPETSIMFFNPEHIYIFSNAYIDKRLRKLGFNEIIVNPSPLLRERQKKKVLDIGCYYYKVCRIIYRLIPTRPVLTPSLIMVARHK